MSRNANSDSRSFRLRAAFAFVLLLAGAGALVARAVNLQLFNRAFLIQQGEARTMREVPTQAGRGTIYDRDGEPLAVSTPVESVYAVPQELAAVPDPSLTHRLDFAKLMGGKASIPSAWPAPFTIDGDNQPALVDLGDDHWVRAAISIRSAA